jgi:hypothetical protein
MKNGTLRIAHIPHLPSPFFYYEVSCVGDALMLARFLAKYDIFLYRAGFRSSYGNCTSLEEYQDGEWSDWYDKELGTSFDELLEAI